MRPFLLCLVMIAFAGPALAQENVPRDDWPPELTEQWEPEPSMVTPGTQPGQPPSDATVLFDGGATAAWRDGNGDSAGWTVNDDGSMTVVPGTGDIWTRESFGSVQLHLEWMTPIEVQGDGQNSGNSGVFLQDRYEVQILNSFDNRTYSNGQAGSIYKQHIPRVNASRPRGQWQVYDIVYEAPVFAEGGELVSHPYVTVMHNGVVIHHRQRIDGTTEWKGLPDLSPHGPGPIRLQDHGNAVSYRNIWIRDL